MDQIQDGGALLVDVVGVVRRRPARGRRTGRRPPGSGRPSSLGHLDRDRDLGGAGTGRRSGPRCRSTTRDRRPGAGGAPAGGGLAQQVGVGVRPDEPLDLVEDPRRPARQAGEIAARARGERRGQHGDVARDDAPGRRTRVRPEITERFSASPWLASDAVVSRPQVANASTRSAIAARADGAASSYDAANSPAIDASPAIAPQCASLPRQRVVDQRGALVAALEGQRGVGERHRVDQHPHRTALHIWVLLWPAAA